MWHVYQYHDSRCCVFLWLKTESSRNDLFIRNSAKLLTSNIQSNNQIGMQVFALSILMVHTYEYSTLMLIPRYTHRNSSWLHFESIENANTNMGCFRCNIYRNTKTNQPKHSGSREYLANDYYSYLRKWYYILYILYYSIFYCVSFLVAIQNKMSYQTWNQNRLRTTLSCTKNIHIIMTSSY